MRNLRATTAIAALGLALGSVAAPASADPHSRFGSSHETSHDSGHWEQAPRESGGFHRLPSTPPVHGGPAPAPGHLAWTGDHHFRDHDGDAWRHDWGGGDIRRFHDHDWDDWRGGHWEHGWNDGVFAWWFVVSGVWFWYPVPVYPYPDPYVPPTFIAPPPPAGAAPSMDTSYWYYCPASNGYYPYVNSCPSGWQQVPTTPGTDNPPQGSPPDDDDAG